MPRLYLHTAVVVDDDDRVVVSLSLYVSAVVGDDDERVVVTLSLYASADCSCCC